MPVKLVKQANTIVGATRVVKLVAVVNGSINIGSPAALYVAYGGGSAFASTADVQGAVVYSDVYLTDGLTVKRLDCATGSASTFAATVGTLPSGYKLLCNWRGRLVLARSNAAPHMWEMSRLGDPADWDYSAQDAAAALSGQNARAGTIGDSIVALVPASDDALVFGCDHSVWVMRGDPLAGGVILPASEQVGFAGPNAWAQDPNGAIYFLSAQGLHLLPPGGAVRDLADDRIAHYFAATDPAAQDISLAWDRDRGGLWIFRSGATAAGSTHLYYDQRTGSFWPVETANADLLPQCAMVYDGDDPDDRRLIVGGASDKLYFYDTDALTDAGTTIDAYVYVGPVMPAGAHGEARMVLFDTTLGEYPDRNVDIGCYVELRAAKTPFLALTNPAETRTFSYAVGADDGRQEPECVSVSGRCFLLKIYDRNASSETFVVDQFSGEFQSAGGTH